MASEQAAGAERPRENEKMSERDEESHHDFDVGALSMATLPVQQRAGVVDVHEVVGQQPTTVVVLHHAGDIRRRGMFQDIHNARRALIDGNGKGNN